MKKKKLIIGFSIYFGVLILIYLGMTLYFQDRFLPGSVINNVDYSSKTVAEVESDIANEMQDYSLTLIEREMCIRDRSYTLGGRKNGR